MVKHSQTMSVFDHFVGLVQKGLILEAKFDGNP